MLAAGMIAIAPQAAQAARGSKTFLVSGGLGQNWNVPSDVHSITITTKGAAGGAGGLEGGSGGRGASGTVTVPVTPGQLISVYLGKRGGDAGTDNPLFEGGGGAAAALLPAAPVAKPHRSAVPVVAAAVRPRSSSAQRSTPTA